DVNPDAIPLDCFDGWSMRPAVESPAICLETRGEFMFHFLGDEVINLRTVDDLPRQRNVIWRDYRRVIAAWLRQWNGCSRRDALRIGGNDITEQRNAAGRGCCSCQKFTTRNHNIYIYLPRTASLPSES